MPLIPASALPAPSPASTESRVTAAAYDEIQVPMVFPAWANVGGGAAAEGGNEHARMVRRCDASQSIHPREIATACDECGADCSARSWFATETGEDFCGVCHEEKGKGHVLQIYGVDEGSSGGGSSGGGGSGGGGSGGWNNEWSSDEGSSDEGSNVGDAAHGSRTVKLPPFVDRFYFIKSGRQSKLW
jgi:hypothetical protein